jgi:hypothetical protein
MRTIQDISNRRFGRLIAIKLAFVKPLKRGTLHFWLCKCDCGKEKSISKQKLLSGETKSCGCLQRDTAKRDSTTHGLAGHPLWSLWRDIRNRCYNPKVNSYHLYGGRGVAMCEEWRNDFMAFYNWAIGNGWKPGLQIDKDKKAREIGVEPLLYSPERCEFVTPKENNNNRRSNVYIEFNGETKTVAQWSELYGMSQHLVSARLRRGWPIEQALTIDTKLTGKRKCFH